MRQPFLTDPKFYTVFLNYCIHRYNGVCELWVPHHQHFGFLCHKQTLCELGLRSLRIPKLRTQGSLYIIFLIRLSYNTVVLTTISPPPEPLINCPFGRPVGEGCKGELLSEVITPCVNAQLNFSKKSTRFSVQFFCTVKIPNPVFEACTYTYTHTRKNC